VKVYSGLTNIDGRPYALAGGAYAATREDLTHLMHGLSIKSHSNGRWDGELAASRYDYQRDEKRQNAADNPRPGAESGGAGTLADGSGTGWTTLAAKGIWRPEGPAGEHIAEFGMQQDRYQLRYRTSGIAGNYLQDEPGGLVSEVRGDARLTSLWAQDLWRFAPAWSAVLGGRAERWQTSNGLTAFSASSAQAYPERQESFFSPKGALSWQWRPETVLKASVGRAVRMPTVAELYGATSTTNSQFINDPNLRPERSWTGELSAETEFAQALARLTLFAEQTQDALYSQTVFDDVANRNVSRVQNIELIRTRGIEAAINGSDVGVRGLDMSASLTYTRSFIEKNAGFVAVPGDTIGKWQPNIPRWRATTTATWRVDPDLSASIGLRYSGKQYRTLDNSDVNGFTYMGVSSYFTTDLRLRWRPARQWTVALGIDNLNNYKYWNFHPYPQRSYSAELKWDL
jgi:iron complex outermembrane receptor protein